MTRTIRFGIGGLGGLLPVIASLVAVDLTAIADLIDKHTLTEGLCIGYAIRILGLFILGGIMAALNSEVTNPLALIQIGIAAPALVTSYLSGAVLNKTIPAKATMNFIINSAYASDRSPTATFNIVVAGGFLEEVGKGIVPGFREQLDTPNNKLAGVGKTVTACVGDACSGRFGESYDYGPTSGGLTCDFAYAHPTDTDEQAAKLICTVLNNYSQFNVSRLSVSSGGRCGMIVLAARCHN
jgi:hypothetical protein